MRSLTSCWGGRLLLFLGYYGVASGEGRRISSLSASGSIPSLEKVGFDSLSTSLYKNIVRQDPCFAGGAANAATTHSQRKRSLDAGIQKKSHERL